MRTRIDLHNLLCETLGSSHCYYNPPSNLKMTYPCIRYSRDRIMYKAADNKPYMLDHYYQIIVIDEDPDSEIVERVAALPSCEHVNHYVSDNLNHDVFTIYY